MIIIETIVQIALSAAPWLLLGLVFAGLIKGFVSPDMINRWVGGRGVTGIFRGAIIGIPLPLCSCGAIPTAMTLHRNGAGRGPTTSFLIATPGVGADSMAISYALLGPVMMAARVMGAGMTAMITGVLVATQSERTAKHATTEPPACCSASCGADDACSSRPAKPTPDVRQKLKAGLRYSFVDLFNDLKVWLAMGLILAGMMAALLPLQSLAAISSSPWLLPLMALIGIPLYICATAATPIAAGLLIAGVSPGAVLVFLLAAPITSLATLLVLRREFGNQGLFWYLLGIVITTSAVGWLTNRLFGFYQWDISAQMNAGTELLPLWLSAIALAGLIIWGITPQRWLSFVADKK